MSLFKACSCDSLIPFLLAALAVFLLSPCYVSLLYSRVTDSSDGKRFLRTVSLETAVQNARKAFRQSLQELFADIMNLLSYICAKEGLDPTEKFNVPIYQPEGSPGMH